ncbi:MAG: carboxylesterase/lipase family protein, partial [Candidatus Helarchaeota archaeon]|nr:carboxylesterase/lipase family protein [Candidatus Helarchaeota archaeon]
RFGGDPNNVTIFGESAGGASVAILLAIPAARGLFHKAIMESGTANPKGFRPKKAREGAEKFMAKLRIEKGKIDDLRKLPLKKIMRAQRRIAGGVGQIADVPFRPFIDSKIIPEHPLEIIRKGKSSNVPIIIGSNKDELAFISRLLNHAADERTKKSILDAVQAHIQSIGIEKKKLDKLIIIYKEIMEKKYPNNAFKYLDAFISDFMFGIPIIRNIEAYVKYQPNIYCYIFTYGSRTDGTAFHTIEIPFVFGNLDTTDTQKGAIGTGEEEEKLAKNVMDAWVAFTRTGNPNHNGLPEWPTYDLKRRATMMLGINSKVEDDPIENIRKAWYNIM